MRAGGVTKFNEQRECPLHSLTCSALIFCGTMWHVCLCCRRLLCCLADKLHPADRWGSFFTTSVFFKRTSWTSWLSCALCFHIKQQYPFHKQSPWLYLTGQNHKVLKSLTWRASVNLIPKSCSLVHCRSKRRASNGRYTCTYLVQVTVTIMDIGSIGTVSLRTLVQEAWSFPNKHMSNVHYVHATCLSFNNSNNIACCFQPQLCCRVSRV